MKTFLMWLFAWLAGLTVLVAFQFLAIDHGRAGARADNRAVWHAVICTIEDATLKNPRATSTQKADAIKFWTTLLVDKVHGKPCN